MVELCAVEDLADGEMRHLQVGDRSVMLCRVGGKLHATNGICPHRGALLGQGVLSGTQVVCPWHGWSFDVTTGEGITNPMSSVETFSVTEEKGRVLIEI